MENNETKKKEPFFQLIVNGVASETIQGREQLSKSEKEFSEMMEKMGYTQHYGSTRGSHGYDIYFNEDKLKAIVIGWRELTGLVDKNGETIYHGDMVSKDGETYELCAYPDVLIKNGKEYYLRSFKTWKDFPISEDDIKKDFTVVHVTYHEVEGGRAIIQESH